MEFRIFRTSDRHNTKTPVVTGAVLKSWSYTYSVDEKEITTKTQNGWFVEINTLDELMALCNNVDHEIIVTDSEMTIEIYDDYRE